MNSGEENSPTTPARIRTSNLFDHESGVLTNKLSLPSLYISM